MKEIFKYNESNYQHFYCLYNYELFENRID